MREQLFDAFFAFLLGFVLIEFIFRYLIYSYIKTRRSKEIDQKVKRQKSFWEILFFTNLKNNIPKWLFYGNIIYLLFLPCFLIIFLASILVSPLVLVVLWIARVKSGFDSLVVALFIAYYAYCRLTNIKRKA